MRILEDDVHAYYLGLEYAELERECSFERAGVLTTIVLLMVDLGFPPDVNNWAFLRRSL